MIPFKQFLTESRSAPLYHATPAENAIAIIATDNLERSTHPEDRIGKRTVSLTRNFIFARNWISELGNVAGVIFEFDQRKLSQRFKIQPFNYFADYTNQARLIPSRNLPKRDYVRENQFEEAVLADIKPVTKYLNKVYIIRNQKYIPYEEYMVEKLESKGVKVEYIT